MLSEPNTTVYKFISNNMFNRNKYCTVFLLANALNIITIING